MTRATTGHDRVPQMFVERTSPLRISPARADPRPGVASARSACCLASLLAAVRSPRRVGIWCCAGRETGVTALGKSRPRFATRWHRPVLPRTPSSHAVPRATPAGEPRSACNRQAAARYQACSFVRRWRAPAHTSPTRRAMIAVPIPQTGLHALAYGSSSRRFEVNGTHQWRTPRTRLRAHQGRPATSNSEYCRARSRPTATNAAGIASDPSFHRRITS